MKEYYSYKFQVRTTEGMTPRLGDQLVDDIKKNSYFGVCLGVMYVVEFQKRGLPHVHILIWHFPKKYSPTTTFDQSGFPNYKRRKTNITIKKGKAELDNQYVVPYNRDFDLKALWDTHWPHMVDDILLNERKLTGNALLQLNEKQLQYFGLAEIHKLLKSIGKSLKDYNQMPQPPISYLDSRLNNLIIEETSYDVTEMEEEFKDLFANCNKEQLEIAAATNSNREYAEDDICIPEEFCNLEVLNSVDKMINTTFPNFQGNYKNPDYLSERAILTPTNQTVGQVNSNIVEMLPGEMFSYFSVDTAEDFPGTEHDQIASFPPEYLNSINISGIPLHELKLKVGVAVMLMRNLNQTLGLCNGTRMMVTKCLKHCVQCEVISGSYKGTRHFIPRMELCPTETRLPFKLCRKQMPLQICYAMTINKVQGQSLQTVGLFMPKSVFTHGQLYVAVSRVTSPQGLKFFIDDLMGKPTNITQNVVYKEVFYNVTVTL
ncbi:hypothetical protein POM88_007254 [Heracleum sosnowskyi]|uniref:ATP-dependent DNA helicase n=1 Tax=Heracleum sosnowskyi TaxID=360622 RepID=A0AAD8J749_9APIA|nr:hypothetical protein POM88_007254 [Heracleum sosnowskyi]